jgi:toxin-antitoxin system PIN domain toxin
VIAIDTNILVYAHREDAPGHKLALSALTALAEGRGEWAVPWPCLHEFMAIVTHPRIFRIPTPLTKALAQVHAWLESPTLVLLAETPDHWSHLQRMLIDGRVAGPMVHDARVAALCEEHGIAELWSADRDFGRFPHVKVRNPLVR